ncbi:hypothetical protein QJS10_CPA03g00240 [Acorus calamus]|uniref:Uncharacterized protein n=1 Tax=Acorus calamus TaxID=4465 RepID=A0AAV9F6G9_ACOCL|nr:hypothetical protein QJS10_CPA03g00240 [Acorus calamus]
MTVQAHKDVLRFHVLVKILRGSDVMWDLKASKADRSVELSCLKDATNHGQSEMYKMHHRSKKQCFLLPIMLTQSVQANECAYRQR